MAALLLLPLLLLSLLLPLPLLLTQLALVRKTWPRTGEGDAVLLEEGVERVFVWDNYRETFWEVTVSVAASRILARVWHCAESCDRGSFSWDKSGLLLLL